MMPPLPNLSLCSRLPARISVTISMSHWLADPEIAAGRMVERHLAEVRAPIPCPVAWRSRQTGNALRRFVQQHEQPDILAALTAGL